MAKTLRELNARGTHVWLHHPETDGTWECPVDVEEVFLGRGWEHCPAPDLSLKGLFDDLPPQQRPEEGVTAFDPAEHSAADVNAYLAQHADSAPGEVERVLGLERAGKDRSTIRDPRTTENEE